MTDLVNDQRPTRARTPNLVVMQVIGPDGNPIQGLKNENVKVLEVTKKISIDLYNKIQEIPGAFIAQI